MKTKKEIEEKIEYYFNMLERPENQNETMEIKIYGMIYALKWVLQPSKEG